MNKPQNLIDLAILNLYVKGTDADREVLDKLYSLSEFQHHAFMSMLRNAVKDFRDKEGKLVFDRKIFHPMIDQEGKRFSIVISIEAHEAPAIQPEPGDHAQR